MCDLNISELYLYIYVETCSSVWFPWVSSHDTFFSPVGFLSFQKTDDMQGVDKYIGELSIVHDIFL